MKKKSTISTLFIDVGGVLLTNGWDRHSREHAAKIFKLDFKEMDDRHRLMFDTYEIGKISLEEYLQQVVFYKKRNFSKKEFQEFMFAQSQAFPEMIDLVAKLKSKYNLKVVVVSNEGKELTEYRIEKFKLRNCVDFFVSSCFVHFKKPDPEIFKMAIDLSQSKTTESLYIDDRELFVEAAETLGMHGLHHTDIVSTRKKLAKYFG